VGGRYIVHSIRVLCTSGQSTRGGAYRLNIIHPVRITVIMLIIKEILQVLPGYHGTGFYVSAWWIYAKETK